MATSSPAPSHDDPPRWTTIIGAHQGLWDWKLSELWSCRDLISLFIWRDFISVYKQTILGPAWHLLQPLLTTLTFTFIFGKIAALSTNGIPPFLFYLSGNILWSFFSNCLIKTANTFISNSTLLSKVYFHRLSIPISILFSTLITFGIQLLLFLTLWIIYFFLPAAHPHYPSFLLLPLSILLLSGYALGGGIMVSAVTTRYRDLAIVLSFGVQLLMFITPVIYPLASVPEKYQWMISLNPLTPIFESFRYGFFGGTAVSLSSLGISFFFMILLLTVSLMLFSRIEKTFMDTI